MSKAVQKVEIVQTQPAPAEPPSLTANLLPMLREILTNPAISPERVTQTLDFYERMDRIQGRKAFDLALANAKANFDPIIKRHKVEYGSGEKRTSYKHEDLFDVHAAVQPALSAEGIIVRYRATSNVNEPIRVTCVVSHRDGYSEETTLSAGADNSGGKNSIQQMASTLTYLQRYTLRLALGLAASRDDDGKAAGGDTSDETIGQKQEEELQALIVKTNSDLPRFYAYYSKLFRMNITRLSDIPANRFEAVKKSLEAKQSKQQGANNGAA